MNCSYRLILFIPLFILFSSITVAQSVGIGTNSPDSSAKLEISSSNSGLLLPRLSQVQRNGIRNPKAGLVVWCSDCGSGGELSVYNGMEWKTVNLNTNNNSLPFAPNDLIAFISGSSQHVLLKWVDNSNNELGFKIERKYSNGNYTEVGQVSADVVTFADDIPFNNAVYTYRVSSFNSMGASPQYSNEVQIRAITLPVLTTNSVVSITSNSAVCGGNITTSDSTIIERGVCWSENINPTADLPTKTIDSLGVGNFVSNIIGLISNRTYHVRAYAKTNNSIAYGQDSVFTTLTCSPFLTSLLGSYANTNEDFGGAYGPYTTKISRVTQISPTSATIQVENIYNYNWGPVIFTLDWSNPSNKLVTLQRQTDLAPASTVTSNAAYTIWNVMVDASPTLGPGTFSFENQTLMLKMRVGLRNPTPPNQGGFFGTPYIVNMAR